MKVTIKKLEGLEEMGEKGMLGFLSYKDIEKLEKFMSGNLGRTGSGLHFSMKWYPMPKLLFQEGNSYYIILEKNLIQKMRGQIWMTICVIPKLKVKLEKN